MDKVQSNPLEELNGSEFQIEGGMPNIQGWKIDDIHAERVGKVRDLLFDKNTRKVRYIITKLEGDDQEVLIPIENVELSTSESRVIVRGLTLGQLFGLPTYIAGDISIEDEYAIQNVFRGGEEKEADAGHTR